MCTIATIANTVQLIGALVTAYGLLVAYGRAKGIPEQVRKWLRARHFDSGDVIVQPAPAVITVTGGTPHGDVVRFGRLAREASIDYQLGQLEDEVIKLRDAFIPVYRDIVRLDGEISEAKARAGAEAEQIRREANDELMAFNQKLDQLQGVDLSVAIVGVLISAMGIVVGVWA